MGVEIGLNFERREGTKDPVDFIHQLDFAIIQGMPELLREMAPILEQRAIRAFREGGFPVRWKPSQRVVREGGQTLVVTRRLMDSFRIGNSENILRIVGNQFVRRLVYGTETPYAKYHMSTLPRTIMPYRPAIVFDATLEEELDRIAEAWGARKEQEAKQ